MKWTNSYRSFGLKTKRSTGLKTIEHKQACSKHLKVLVDCGYATVEKRESDSSRHMVRWYALTSAGRDAFSGHIAELKRLASGLL